MENKKEIVCRIIRDISSEKQGGWTLGRFEIDNKQVCYTCEDEFRAVKVKGETRLRAGIWPIRINRDGGMNVKFKELFPDMHKGMIEIVTPDFANTYIHPGNKEADTNGCPLVGMTRDTKSGTVGQSRDAYKKLVYPALIKKLLEAEKSNKTLYIEIIDKDR